MFNDILDLYVPKELPLYYQARSLVNPGPNCDYNLFINGLPSNISQYSNQLIRALGSEDIYYVKIDGTMDKVPLIDKSVFSSQSGGHLTSEEFRQKVTSNGGYVCELDDEDQ